MTSIIEQERRKAVKDYQSQISMVHHDEVEESYTKGWDDCRKAMPIKMKLFLYFNFGVFIGFILAGIFM